LLAASSKKLPIVVTQSEVNKDNFTDAIPLVLEQITFPEKVFCPAKV
jgi:hypothetical protein